MLIVVADSCVSMVHENEEQLESFASVMTLYVTRNVLLVYHNVLNYPS